MRHDREAHETAAANAARQRRLERGEPPARYVLDAWRQRLRVARVARLSPADRKRVLG